MSKVRVLFGGHWTHQPGWTLLTERDQDITKNLNFQNESVDTVFSEHVIEHVALESAVHFMKESLRILKKGGVFRASAPMLDKLLKFENDEKGLRYAAVSLAQWFPHEDRVLKELGLNGVATDARPFIFDSLLKKHGHQFVWTVDLMKKVLLKVGFSVVNECEPGSSKYDPDSAIERKIRGVHAEELTRDLGITVYDPESCVIEAIK